MITKFLTLYFFASPLMAQNDGLGYQPVRQNYKQPKGWVVNPRLVFNNNTPPIIYVDQAATTTITFPEDIHKCRIRVDAIKIVEEKKESATYEIDLITNKAGVDALAAAAAVKGQTIYDSPPFNMNCRFKNGKLAIIWVKIYPYPYLSVKMVTPGSNSRDYSIFAGQPAERERIEKTPYYPKNSNPSNTVIAESKRDYTIFKRVLGDHE